MLTLSKLLQIQATRQIANKEMNRSIGSAYVPSLLSILCTVKINVVHH